MIKEMHEFVTGLVFDLQDKESVTKPFRDPHENVVWTRDAVVLGSWGPDAWQDDLELDIVLGHKSVFSFLHMGVKFNLLKDHSRAFGGIGSLASLGSDRPMKVSKRARALIINAGGLLPPNEEAPLLKDVTFPDCWSAERQMAYEGLWDRWEQFTFGLHIRQDAVVPHHRAGFLGMGHVDFENHMWEVIEEMGIVKGQDLMDAYQSLLTFCGGFAMRTPNDEAYQALYALHATLEAVNQTERFIFGEAETIKSRSTRNVPWRGL